jgi:hypothetical protein
MKDMSTAITQLAGFIGEMRTDFAQTRADVGQLRSEVVSGLQGINAQLAHLASSKSLPTQQQSSGSNDELIKKLDAIAVTSELVKNTLHPLHGKISATTLDVELRMEGKIDIRGVPTHVDIRFPLRTIVDVYNANVYLADDARRAEFVSIVEIT